MNKPQNKSRTDRKTTAIIALSVLLAISVLFNISQILMTVFPNEREVTLSLMPGTLKNQTLPQGAEIQGWFEANGLKNVSEDMFSFNSSNPDVAAISFDKISSDKYVYYKIHALSPGETFLSINCPQAGSMTEPICITVSQDTAPTSATPNLSPTPESVDEITPEQSAEIFTYIINVKSGKFHYDNCKGVQTMNEDNKMLFTGTRTDAINQGYDACGTCNP